MRFGILGPVTAWAGAEPVAVGGPREQKLLAALLLAANHRVTPDRLVEVLWDGVPPATCRDQVHNSVAILRRNLGAPIRWDGGGFVIDVPPEQLDAAEFELLVRQADELADREAAGLLRQALGLWRGPALDGLNSQLLRSQARRLDEQQLACLERRIDLDLSLGQHHELVGELTALVGGHPLREKLYAQLMMALYRSGRQAEALQTYRQARELLVDELGIEPGPELVELERRILAVDPALAGQQREPATAVHQLPPDTSTFTGRDAQLRQLDAALDQCPGRPVLITGTVGVGKTALSLRWTHRLGDRYPDGQLYINLQGHSTCPPVPPMEALGRFLRALGVPAERVPDDVGEASGLFRSLMAGRRMIIVLDDAHEPGQVRPLLPGGPGSLVVATSRDSLAGLVARDGAHRIVLDALTPAESLALLCEILGAERVAAEPEAALELAALCGHLPLAIRIAAAALTEDVFRGIGEQAALLRDGDRLADLTVDDDDQSSVRLAFDLSYSRLKPAAQRMFGLLGLVPGPDFTPTMAAVLAGVPEPEAARLLGQLAAAHLVNRNAPGRMAFHGLVRIYAERRIPAAEHPAACRRLLDFWQRAVDAADWTLTPDRERPDPPPGVPAFADAEQALAWLDAELPNLVPLVTYSAMRGYERDACRLSAALQGYFQLRRTAVEWRMVVEAAVKAAAATDDRRAKAGAWLNLAALHVSLAEWKLAEQHYTTALELCEQSGWRVGQATVLNRLSQLLWETGRPREGAQRAAAALAINRELGRPLAQANDLNALAIARWQLGQCPAAVEDAAEALALFRAAGAQVGTAVALTILGGLSIALGRYDQAAGMVTEALELNTRLDNRFTEALSHLDLAELYRDTGRFTEALAEATLARTHTEGVDAFRCLDLAVRNTIGTIHCGLNQWDAAAAAFGGVLDQVAGQQEYRFGWLNALAGLAVVDLEAGNSDQALARALEALDLAREAGYRGLEGKIAGTLAAVALAAGDQAQAQRYAEAALAIHRETGNHLGRQRAEDLLGLATQGGVAAT